MSAEENRSTGERKRVKKAKKPRVAGRKKNKKKGSEAVIRARVGKQ